MLKALDVLEDLAVVSAQDDDEIEETVIFLYLGIRLKPLLGKYNIDEDKINEIATQLADNYFDKSLSLDLMINSIYNYFNFVFHGVIFNSCFFHLILQVVR